MVLFYQLSQQLATENGKDTLVGFGKISLNCPPFTVKLLKKVIYEKTGAVFPPAFSILSRRQTLLKQLLLRFVNSFHTFIRLIAVQLGDHLKGGVHGQHRHAGVQRRDIAVGHIHGHGAAAAGVHLAQLRDLPDDLGPVKDTPDIAHRLGAGITGAGLATGAGVLAQTNAVVQIGGVLLFKHLTEVGIVGRRHVGTEAEGILQTHPQGRALSLAQILHKGVKGSGLHTGHTVGADLLLVRQHADGGFGRRLVQIQQCLQGGVAADAVVMAVGADHGAVQADLRGLHSRHRFQYLKKTLYSAGIPNIEIERDSAKVRIYIHCSRPGVVIGKGGAEIERIRLSVEKMIGKPVALSIVEVRTPDTNAQLVAENIAAQLEKRIGFRRAMKNAMGRAMRMGARGIKIMCSGRLGGAEIARTECYHEGTIPLQTIRADIEYGFAEAATTYGRVGVKVWIYKGEILSQSLRTTPRTMDLNKRDDRRRDRRDGDRRGRGGYNRDRRDGNRQGGRPGYQGGGRPQGGNRPQGGYNRGPRPAASAAPKEGGNN